MTENVAYDTGAIHKRRCTDALNRARHGDKVIELATEACKVIIAKGLRLVEDRVVAGIPADNIQANEAAQKFVNSNHYKVLENHGADMARSMHYLISERARYAKMGHNTHEAAKNASLTAQKYAVEVMMARYDVFKSSRIPKERTIGEGPAKGVLCRHSGLRN